MREIRQCAGPPYCGLFYCIFLYQVQNDCAIWRSSIEQFPRLKRFVDVALVKFIANLQKSDFGASGDITHSGAEKHCHTS